MNLHLVDWCIIIGFFIFVTAVASYARRYTKSVADFLAANRCAGRYLLTVSEGMASLGAISLVAMFEMSLQAGFSGTWWVSISLLMGTIIAISGWVIYRFRQSRALTMAEFMERRYSRKFRIFMGLIMVVSGVLNFGIFPAIGTHFFINFCGFSDSFSISGVSIPTYPVVMAVLLIISLYFTYMGGQIAVMLTDFIQAIFCYIVFTIIGGFVLVSLGWEPIVEVLGNPENVHMVNPFKGGNIPDFNVWYFVMMTVLGFYGVRAWQGSQGYNSSALSPHEAKMGAILGSFRGFALNLGIMMVPIAAYVILRHPDFINIADKANAVFENISDDQVRNQITVPVVMSFFLPKGLLGCFAAVFLAAFVSTHDTYLHSWGSILIQDVVMPFRKKPFGKKQHMHLLRFAILGVAVFIFFFSLIWRQVEAIMLWFQITGAIYLGGAGVVIIGGLYWKKGTTAAAYSAMSTGSVLAISAIVVQQIDSNFFLNGMQMSFITAIAACSVYVIVSLLSPRGDCNFDKLLHRGPFAVAEDVAIGDSETKSIWYKFGLTKEFTVKDKVIFFFSLGLSFLWFFIFIAGTIYHVIFGIETKLWIKYWHFYVLFIFAFVVCVVIWMLIGGIIDIRKMFTRLRTLKRDEHDDGWVNKPE